MAKTKLDPLFARPDGTRAKSAWLTKLQTAAKTFIDNAPRAYNILPTNTLEANGTLLRRSHQGWGDPPMEVAWECLIQWHGPDTVNHFADRLADKNLVKLMNTVNTETAQALLLEKLSFPEVREAVASRAERWPLYTLRGLLAQNPNRDQPAAQLLQRLLHLHPEWLEALQAALLAEGDDTQTKTLSRLLVQAEKVVEAGMDELPALLREPPWRAGKARSELPVLNLTPRREPAVVDWPRWQGGTVEPRSLGTYYELERRFRECLIDQAL